MAPDLSLTLTCYSTLGIVYSVLTVFSSSVNFEICGLEGALPTRAGRLDVAPRNTPIYSHVYNYTTIKVLVNLLAF